MISKRETRHAVACGSAGLSKANPLRDDRLDVQANEIAETCILRGAGLCHYRYSRNGFRDCTLTHPLCKTILRLTCCHNAENAIRQGR